MSPHLLQQLPAIHLRINSVVHDRQHLYHSGAAYFSHKCFLLTEKFLPWPSLPPLPPLHSSQPFTPPPSNHHTTHEPTIMASPGSSADKPDINPASKANVDSTNKPNVDPAHLTMGKPGHRRSKYCSILLPGDAVETQNLYSTQRLLHHSAFQNSATRVVVILLMPPAFTVTNVVAVWFLPLFRP
ncbi:hypothetical protein GGR57DRAFT_455914 [Xylariaceae sp. FL1272]|nr:hypothetical protein GGR57DRAFT_455914 [Xylariaceae sp. FL1272]